MRSVCFLSDFGYSDDFAGTCRGVIARLAPQVSVIDITHGVARGDVLGGALSLRNTVRYLPEEAVHLAVVDPGVGTLRRPLCVVDPAGRRLVGPDNGLFTPFLGAGSAAFLLSDPGIVPRDPSPTFHGRDLFAPVAAWLAGGGSPERLGPRVSDPAGLDWPSPGRKAGELEGQCLAADPFGNLTTSIRRGDLADSAVATVTVGEHTARLVSTFGEGEPGELVALWGSSGRLEIAVREGNAARELGLGRGAPVRLRLRDG
jgi:hypothetical protein